MPGKTLQAITAVASLALAACASPSIASVTAAKDIAAHRAAPAVDVKAQHRARDLLERLLTLIEQSKSIADMTPERIGKVFGVRLRSYGPDDFGYSEDISRTWTWNIDRIDYVDPKHWDFGFRADPHTSPPMTEICALDYDQFIARLKQMGFDGGPHYVEHGRVLYGDFVRDRLEVRVAYQGESEGAAGHRCIDLIQVL